VDDLGEAAAADLALVRLEQLPDVAEEGGGRLGGAVLVAVAIGEEEALFRQRQAWKR
jgi:hypothetical protein